MRRWLAEPDFALQHQDQRQGLVDQALKRLQQLAAAAADRLAQLVASEDEDVAIKAVALSLGAVAKLDDHLFTKRELRRLQNLVRDQQTRGFPAIEDAP